VYCSKTEEGTFRGNPRSYARKSMFEKGRNFSLPYFVKRREVLQTPENCSFEVNYLV
jgi:hypothetical protein